MNIKILCLTIVGFLFLALGAIGLILPVWPTTPFVICAAACFSCTPRLKAWLLQLPFFGEHIRNYQNREGLQSKTVITSLVFLWGMLLLSCILIQTIWIMCILATIGTMVTIHILYMAKPRGEEK